MKPLIIPVFIPNQGCPNVCIFCNQKKITGMTDLPGRDDVRRVIEEGTKGDGSLFYRKKSDKKKETRPLFSLFSASLNKPQRNTCFKEVAFYGGSFTGLDLKYQEELLGEGKKAIDSGLIEGIRISTRPDYINERVLKTLKAYGVRTIELGVQSFSDRVLESSKRGHNSSCIFNACEIIRESGFNLGIQLMMGLPQDSEETLIDSAEKAIGIKPNFVRIYPVLVLKDTELEELYLKGEYKPLSMEETIRIGKVMVKGFYMAGIPVIRFGLQPTDTINPDKDVIAGPFHPSLRHIIDSELAFEKMKMVIEANELSGRQVSFSVPKKEISIFQGIKKENIRRLKKVFGLKGIHFVVMKNVETCFPLPVR